MKCTDHDALRWTWNLADASEKLVLWRLQLSEFEFDVAPRVGINHQAPDALSCLPTDGHDTRKLNDALPVLVFGPLSSGDDAEDNEPAYVMDEELDKTSPALSDVAVLTTSEDTPSEQTAKAFLREQSKDYFSCTTASTVGMPGSEFSYNQNAFLV